MSSAFTDNQSAAAAAGSCPTRINAVVDRAQRSSLLERICDALPGWMFCVSGAALLAVVVLTPIWLTHHETAWRLRVMQAQAGALHQQTEHYQQFAAAIADDDPVVLERLALTHLRQTIKGKTPLWVRPVEQDTGDIGAWLAVAQPVLGRDVPYYVVPSNRLTRLVTGPGPGRPALVVIGLLCLVAGVLFNPRSGRRGVQRRAVEPVRKRRDVRVHSALPARTLPA